MDDGAQTRTFPSLHVLDHPLIAHKLSLMRDASCSTKDFRTLLREIALLMGYELTRDLPVREEAIVTPVAPTMGRFIAGKKVAIVPILRAGLGMADGLLDLMPSARIGHIGVYRDPGTLHPVEYLVKLPEVTGRTFIVVDPMLATGNSAVHAVDILSRHGVAGHDIRFMALVAAPEGIATLSKAHPDVRVYVAALDERLNDHAYIVPGLGDAGDRLFGTK